MKNIVLSLLMASSLGLFSVPAEAFVMTDGGATSSMKIYNAFRNFFGFYRGVRKVKQPAACSSNQKCYAAESNQASCNFYPCLSTKSKCGSKGYAMSYGYKYCTRFSNFDKFYGRNTRVIRWKNKTLSCLQKALYFEYKNLSLGKPKTSKNARYCKQLSKYAFKSHACCYLYGGICYLNPVTQFKIFTVVDVRELASMKTAKQASQTAASCAMTGFGWFKSKRDTCWQKNIRKRFR